MNQNNLIRVIAFLLLIALIAWAADSANAAGTNDFEFVKKVALQSENTPLLVEITNGGNSYTISVLASTDPNKPNNIILMVGRDTPDPDVMELEPALIDIHMDGTLDYVMDISGKYLEATVNDQKVFDTYFEILAKSLE